MLVEIEKLMVGLYSEDKIWSRFVLELGKLNSTLGSVVPLAMFFKDTAQVYKLQVNKPRLPY